MIDIIAIFNAGSATLKFALFAADGLRILYRGQVDYLLDEPVLKIKDATGQAIAHHNITHTGQMAGLHAVLDWLDTHDDLNLVVAGHRIVHGGSDFTQPVKINANIQAALKKLIPLAPLHQPHNLAIAESLAMARPGLNQIACFDTAFHHTQNRLHTLFALPVDLYDQGIRKYGFHGLSYEYIASQLPEYTSKTRVIAAHLGNGASLCAIQNLQSVATSTGFSTLDGLMMGTRCGSLDPGVVLYLQQQLQMPLGEIVALLYHQSGLKGVSGITHDMEQLLASDQPAAKEAINLYCLTAARQIAGLAADLHGFDTLVFTGGIGENAPPVRMQICQHLAWLGLKINIEANQGNRKQIHADDSQIEVYIIPTDEEYMMAKHCQPYAALLLDKDKAS